MLYRQLQNSNANFLFLFDWHTVRMMWTLLFWAMKSTPTGNEENRLLLLLTTHSPAVLFSHSHTHIGYDTMNSRMNYQALETIDVKQEQEFWNEVIDRTTQ